MKKAHREIAGLRGHSTLTKAEQFSPVAWSVATMRTVLVDGKIVALVTSCERSAGVFVAAAGFEPALSWV